MAKIKSKTFLVKLVIIVFIFASIIFSISILNIKSNSVEANINNGVQEINISVGLGYNPNNFVAKANVPTKLYLKTKNTYDCTAYLSIPSLNIEKFLPPTGITEIDLGIQKAGTDVVGSCGNETYRFSVKFS